MNAKTIATAVILSFAAVGAAQAQTPRGDSDNVPFQGVYAKTDAGAGRVEVAAQLEQARIAGLTSNYESNNQPFVAQIDNGVRIAALAGDSNSVHDMAFGDIDNQPFQGA